MFVSLRQKGRQGDRPLFGQRCDRCYIGKDLSRLYGRGFEYSKDALEYLKKNIALNDAKNVTAVYGDVTVCCGEYDDGIFDLIVSNPPYIESDEIDTLQQELQFEPRMALDGGQDGLYFYRIITEKWHSKLKCGGMLAFEVGERQSVPVSEILEKHVFEKIYTKKDLHGYNRIVCGIKK